mgnify:CR=1 FL=1
MAGTVTLKTEHFKNKFPLAGSAPAASTGAMTRLVTIIPALNAAASLSPVLERVCEAERLGLSAGLVLADGGSSDATREIARRAGARIVTGANGRGAQLAAGADAGARLASPQDWYLFLHADTRL